MTDNDSELADFESYQNDIDEQAAETEADAGQELVGSRTPGRGVPELRDRSEHDRQIRPGDPVKDLWGGSWLVVHSKAADSVKEYDRQQPDTKKSLLDYEGSRCMGATEEDTVWNCFYLNGNNTLAGGRSGPYGFPESRICRYAYEATDGFKKGRFQGIIQMQVLERVAGAALRSGNENFQATIRSMLNQEFGEEQAKEAFELAEATAPQNDG